MSLIDTILSATKEIAKTKTITLKDLGVDKAREEIKKHASELEKIVQQNKLRRKQGSLMPLGPRPKTR